MKKMATIVLGLMLVLTLVGCGNNAQSSDAHNAEYEEGYATGYEAGYNDGKQQIAESKKHFAQFSGSFMATVEQLLPDYYALPVTRIRWLERAISSTPTCTTAIRSRALRASRSWSAFWMTWTHSPTCCGTA